MRRIGLASPRSTPFEGLNQYGLKEGSYVDDQTGWTNTSYKGIKTPGYETAFVPIKFENQLLLGKIGVAAADCCSAILLSVYRLDEGKLIPVAYLGLESSGYEFLFAEEN
jgi:hypothetical protein